MTVTTDRSPSHIPLQTLDEQACLDRLRSQAVGRIAFFQDGDVEVLPVNYTLDDTDIAFLTTGGSKLRPGTRYSNVTFEVDSLEPGSSAGWSVVVKGWADAVSDQKTLDRLDATGLRPWAQDVDRPIWVLIHARVITGRAIVPAS